MLNETTIRNQVLGLIDEVDNSEITREQARIQFANKLTEIIIDAIQSARITFVPGDIRVVGSQTAQQNVTTLILDKKLS